MKFISWNVNGIRAWYKKEASSFLFNSNADFLCLQETKAHPEQLPPELINVPRYFSFFDHSKTKKGYSGVAIYAKEKPDSVDDAIETGALKSDLDQEGRFLALHYPNFSLINCYFPNGGGGEDRLEFKLKYYEAFFEYLKKLQKKQPNIIFCGDVNTAHNEIDLAHPKENKNTSGFLQIERDWLNKIIQAGWVDTFRTLHPETVRYSWWDMKSSARDRNIGWRIDYFFVSPTLADKIIKAEILDDILGSDHCPVLLQVKV